MNRITDKILHGMLILMIGLSFYLTYLIWVSPASHETSLEESLGNKRTEETSLKTKEEVFLPLKLRYQKEDTNQETQNEALLKAIQKELHQTTYSEGEVTTYSKQSDYQRATTMTSGMELFYAFSFPFNTYLELFDLSIPLVDDQEKTAAFSSVQVDFEEGKIRFLNDQELTVVEATLEDDLSSFSSEIEYANVKWVPLEKTRTFLENHYLTKDTLELKKYSYISSTQPYTMFRDAFFSNPKSVRSNSSVFDTYLYEGGNSLTIKQDQEIIQFQGQANTTRPFDIFLTSFDSIKKIGASYGSTRVIDQLDNAIDYRTFVEGFPIFGENHEAQIAFDFKESNESSAVRVTIQANLNSLQIPIPSEESVVLPSSQEVIETLYYKGLDTTLVESLLIGYQWKNLEDTGVVDLIPNWYIKYDNQWYRYEALFQLLAEEEEEAPNGF
ncbi:MAG: hypothetical protein KBH56_01635 [Enterococcus sp.]|nr:hypothetical protein [Enterococcus sp.]